MRNVTISMDDELYRLTRIEAARAGLSMSKFLALAAQEKIGKSGHMTQLEAVEAILGGPHWDVTQDGRMPKATERNARR